MGKYLRNTEKEPQQWSIQSEGISNLYQSHTLSALTLAVNGSIDF